MLNLQHQKSVLEGCTGVRGDASVLGDKELLMSEQGQVWIFGLKPIWEQDEGLNIVCYRPPGSGSSVNTMLFKNI